MTARVLWWPALLLTVGMAASVSARAQRTIPLSGDLGQVLPRELFGMRGVDLEVSAAEQRVAGMDSYLMRSYSGGAAASAFSVYVGYYETQAQGNSIHSPKNCLPGAGWEALTSAPATVHTPQGPVRVTKYLLKRNDERAVVLYWYQGRGRIEANEYLVKWNLLRDAALRRRSDEALARIVVPVTTTEDAALDLAGRVATMLIPALGKALPL
jgi:EpsI family protein